MSTPIDSCKGKKNNDSTIDETRPLSDCPYLLNQHEIDDSTVRPVDNATYRQVQGRSGSLGASDEHDTDGFERGLNDEPKAKQFQFQFVKTFKTPVRPSNQLLKSAQKVGSAASSLSSTSSVFSAKSASGTPNTPLSPWGSRKQSTSYFRYEDTSASTKQAQVDAHSDIGESYIDNDGDGDDDDEQTEEPALESSSEHSSKDRVARKLSFHMKKKISFERLPHPATKSAIWSTIEKAFGTRDRDIGIVYVLQLDKKDVFKIGSTQKTVYERYKNKWCYDGAELVAQSNTPFYGARRAEHLVHADLSEHRRRQKDCFFNDCGRKHREWFHTTLEDVLDTITRWSRFVQHERAYVDHKLSAEAESSVWSLFDSEMIVGKLESDWGNAKPENLKVFEVPVPRGEFKNVDEWKVKVSAVVPVVVSDPTPGIDTKPIAGGEGDSKLRAELVVECGEGVTNEQEAEVFEAEQQDKGQVDEHFEGCFEDQEEEQLEEQVEYKLEGKTEERRSAQEETDLEARNGKVSAAPGAWRGWAEVPKLLRAGMCFDNELERWVFWYLLVMNIAFAAFFM
ncbi:hypothetical protein AK830_g4776 [Neonectria ditissima]|uniref:Bacteriophage T5 Orf172 DNA-binding domain-containing protein n=1 Tax=Neonectria ditissima TaxID=78410 RepID=A0A0P7BM79_9HYPO|nr:hypothetical protein AK830_g4776 [Neonectria ditissima]